ncbi:hypothetical protein ONS95_014272 [Cadophora gregata]|uniref:uncharacterized protein n=1 Tax=Cadophora gregata TaxID=51156 RepID=UPI0026DC79A2|nr:uncharacterized protein ONS95_014272 [Cadophora gregata]KAK0114031.1 hypothetical protein ONS96_014877 [Cadophora gregata f. sp. sojae]KAK0114791.1 hypothetical protein ONS95_014272 [Cadophora gregata]
MTPQTALAVAIALPLALLCIATLIGSAIILARSANQRRLLACDLSSAKMELAKLQKQVAAFPRVGPTGFESQFFREDIESAYGSFFVTVNSHVRRWIEHGGKSSPPRKDSVARIEAILFPKPPAPSSFNKGMDTTLFSNPHQYTVEEICSSIEDNETRHAMLGHIVMSILLKAVTLRKDATSTLLPFATVEVRSLAKLHEAIRTLYLTTPVARHIARYWIYASLPDNNNATKNKRSEYRDVLESLFEPHLPVNADKFCYHADLNDVLDNAIEFGKKVTGRTSDHIETRWGNREDVDWIVTHPALYAVQYMEDGRFVDHCLDRGAMYRATTEETRQDMIRHGALQESA